CGSERRLKRNRSSICMGRGLASWATAGEMTTNVNNRAAKRGMVNPFQRAKIFPVWRAAARMQAKSRRTKVLRQLPPGIASLILGLGAWRGVHAHQDETLVRQGRESRRLSPAHLPLSSARCAQGG